jgi:hypothetical protein
MKKYCIAYTNAGDGERYEIKRDSAHEAFIDLIDIEDNVSNHDIECWIENSKED